jgi:hypothetical protein
MSDRFKSSVSFLGTAIKLHLISSNNYSLIELILVSICSIELIIRRYELIEALRETESSDLKLRVIEEAFELDLQTQRDEETFPSCEIDFIIESICFFERLLITISD